MQRSSLALAALAVAPAVGSSDGEHPVGKVIDLLKDLQAKVKEEGQSEELTFATFQRWCVNSVKTLDSAIAGEKQTIEVLESKVDAKTKQVEVLTDEISVLGEEILKMEAAGEKADEERKEGEEIYKKTEEDVKSTIQGVEDAIAALDASKPAAFVQAKLATLVKLPLFLDQLSAKQMAALENGEEPRDALAVEGDAAQHVKKYDFKSGNVIELLKTLKMKFEDDLVAATVDETNSQNQYTLAKQARDRALEVANEAKTSKETLKGEVETALAEAKSDLESEEADLASDETSLEDTHKNCDEKKSEWDERVKVRENELAAMKVAVEILAKVTGVRTEAPSNPVPPPAPAEAFLMQAPRKVAELLRTSVANAQEESTAEDRLNDVKQKAVALIRKEAHATHSRELAQFAYQLSMETGPFDKVNDMIQKMIFRLMKEQTDEDEHKNWCDIETTKTEEKKSEKEEHIEKKKLQIEDGKTKAQQLLDEITAATEMAASLRAHMDEATEIRNIGKTENKAAIDDSKKAQDALAKAVAVLTAHYKESGMVEKESFELLQKNKKGPVELPEEPASWGASYTGVSDPTAQPGGIVTMLETVAADFAQMEADTKAQEETDQKTYSEEMKASEIEESRRTKEAEMKEANRKRVLDKVASDEKSLKGAEEQLAAAKQYLKELTPACEEGEGGATYDSRKADRDREVSALKEAKEMLVNAFKEDPPSAASFLAPVRSH
jgi:hypothetical protein